MALYITRVELHGANWPYDYDLLHRCMADENFYRVIRGDDGAWYFLPTATYFSQGLLSAYDVRTLATRAVARTGRDADVIVTEAGAITWTLKPVPRENAQASFMAGLPTIPTITALGGVRGFL